MNEDFHIEGKQQLFKETLKRNVIGGGRSYQQTC